MQYINQLNVLCLLSGASIGHIHQEHEWGVLYLPSNVLHICAVLYYHEGSVSYTVSAIKHTAEASVVYMPSYQ